MSENNKALFLGLKPVIADINKQCVALLTYTNNLEKDGFVCDEEVFRNFAFHTENAREELVEYIKGRHIIATQFAFGPLSVAFQRAFRLTNGIANSKQGGTFLTPKLFLQPIRQTVQMLKDKCTEFLRLIAKYPVDLPEIPQEEEVARRKEELRVKQEKEAELTQALVSVRADKAKILVARERLEVHVTELKNRRSQLVIMKESFLSNSEVYKALGEADAKEAEIKELEETILQRTVALRNTLEQVDARETATLEREKDLEAQWARLQAPPPVAVRVAPSSDLVIPRPSGADTARELAAREEQPETRRKEISRNVSSRGPGARHVHSHNGKKSSGRKKAGGGQLPKLVLRASGSSSSSYVTSTTSSEASDATDSSDDDAKERRGTGARSNNNDEANEPRPSEPASLMKDRTYVAASPKPLGRSDRSSASSGDTDSRSGSSYSSYSSSQSSSEEAPRIVTAVAKPVTPRPHEQAILALDDLELLIDAQISITEQQKQRDREQQQRDRELQQLMARQQPAQQQTQHTQPSRIATPPKPSAASQPEQTASPVVGKPQFLHKSASEIISQEEEVLSFLNEMKAAKVKESATPPSQASPLPSSNNLLQAETPSKRDRPSSSRKSPPVSLTQSIAQLKEEGAQPKLEESRVAPNVSLTYTIAQLRDSEAQSLPGSPRVESPVVSPATSPAPVTQDPRKGIDGNKGKHSARGASKRKTKSSVKSTDSVPSSPKETSSKPAKTHSPKSARDSQEKSAPSASPKPASQSDKRSEKRSKRSSHHRSSSTRRAKEKDGAIPAIDLTHKERDEQRERERRERRERELKEALHQQDPQKKVFCHPLFATPRRDDALDAPPSNGTPTATHGSQQQLTSAQGLHARTVANVSSSAAGNSLAFTDKESSHKSVHENFENWIELLDTLDEELIELTKKDKEADGERPNRPSNQSRIPQRGISRRDLGVDLDYYNDLELVTGARLTNGQNGKEGRLDVLLAADDSDLDSMLKELCEGTF